MKNIDAHRGPIVAMTINHRLMYTGSADGTAKGRDHPYMTLAQV